MTKSMLLAALAASTLAGRRAAQAPAGDAAAARRRCRCARDATASTAGAPRSPRCTRCRSIAGQHPAYIVEALKAYKSGERSHPSMRGIAASLSDQDMADLAAYYAQTPPQTAVK